MSPWNGLNRRRFPRFQYPCLVTLRNAQGEKDKLLTHTENIGIGGICVIMKQSLKMFSAVEIEIDLLDLEDHIRCPGKVVWVVRRKMDEKKKPLFYDLGIEFVDIKVKDHKRIEEVIERLAKIGETA